MVNPGHNTVNHMVNASHNTLLALLDYLFNNLFVTFIIKDIKVIKGRYKFYGGYGVPLLSEGFHHDATRLF